MVVVSRPLPFTLYPAREARQSVRVLPCYLPLLPTLTYEPGGPVLLPVPV